MNDEKLELLLPHRKILNYKLKKESKKAEQEIADRKELIENRIVEIKKELEDLKKEKDREYKQKIKVLNKKLKTYGRNIDKTNEKIVVLFNCICNLQLTDAYIEQLKIKANIENEDYKFTCTQIEEIKKHIEVIKNRKEQLVRETSIDDITSLLTVMNNDIVSDFNGNAYKLLEIVSNKINKSDDDSEKRALKKLYEIINERAELLPIIDYFSWVIKQDRDEISALKSEIKTIQNNQKEIKKIKESYIVELRQKKIEEKEAIDELCELLEKPIKNINVLLEKNKKELEPYFNEKKALIEEKKELCEERSNLKYQNHEVARMGEYDPDWDERSERIDELNSEINSIECEIWELDEENKPIIDEKIALKKEKDFEFYSFAEIVEVLNNNNIHLYTYNDTEHILKFIKVKDEMDKLLHTLEYKNNMEDFKNIEEEKRREWMEEEKKEKEELSKLKDKLDIARNKLIQIDREILEADRDIKRQKEKDNRNLFLRILNDTEAVKKAKRHKESKQKERERAEKDEQRAKEEYESKQASLNDRSNRVEEEIEKQRPKEYEPTEKEKKRIRELIREKDKILYMKLRRIKQERSNNEN